jgi:CBS domain-containing protein
MRGEVINRLVVTERGKPVGVLSISDVVASMVEAGAVRRGTVADVMSRSMLVCRAGTPITAVARGMTDARFRSVLVLDAAGKPLGVVSGQDLLAFCKEGGCEDEPVERVMHEALTIHPGASLREAADKMIEHHHHRLIVVDPNQEHGIPLGAISSFDIVAEMAQPGSVWQA